MSLTRSIHRTMAESGGESTGHKSGRKIVKILRSKKKPAALSSDDVKHMNKVVGYIKRHQAQRPATPGTTPP